MEKMTEVYQVYKCNICGGIIEVLHAGKGQLVCCGQPMELLIEKEEDNGKEKHVPVVERTTEGIKVKVGIVEHPMEENHRVEWIEVITQEGEVYKKYLKAGDKPQAEFKLKNRIAKVREYCSLHGLWKF